MKAAAKAEEICNLVVDDIRALRNDYEFASNKVLTVKILFDFHSYAVACSEEQLGWVLIYNPMD